MKNIISVFLRKFEFIKVIYLTFEVLIRNNINFQIVFGQGYDYYIHSLKKSKLNKISIRIFVSVKLQKMLFGNKSP